MDMDIISSSSSSQRTLLLHVITKRKRNFKTSTFPSVISHENHIWIWGLEFLQNAIAPWTACKFSTRVDSILQLSEWWTGASVVWHSWHVFIIFGSRPHNKDVQYRFDVTRHMRDGVPPSTLYTRAIPTTILEKLRTMDCKPFPKRWWIFKNNFQL